MKPLLFLPFLLGQGFLLTSSDEGVIYYVKPFQHTPLTTNCPGQPCETLQYYLKNVNTTINQQKNVTMIFMNGNHTANFTQVIITAPIIKLTANISSKDAVVAVSYTHLTLPDE